MRLTTSIYSSLKKLFAHHCQQNEIVFVRIYSASMLIYTSSIPNGRFGSWIVNFGLLT